MGRVLVCVACLLASSAGALAGGVRVAGPVARIEPASIDLGTLPQGVFRSIEVTLRNEGTAPLRILGVESDCGCTVPRLADSLLAPGATTRLKIELSTYSTSGKISKHVFLRTNDPGAPRATFTLAALVRPPVTLQPSTLDFGALPRGTAAADTVHFAFARSEAGTLDSLAFPAPWFTTEVGQRVEGDSLVYEVRVHLRPDAPPGPIHQTGHIYTSHRLARDLSVQLRGQVCGAFQLDPVNFSFGQLRQGTERERRVRLTALGGTHRVLSATCSEARLRPAVLTVEDGRVYDISLTLPSDMPSGMLRGEVRVTTDVVGEREIVLPVTGVVRRAPSPGKE
jgi:hypothetical protein